MIQFRFLNVGKPGLKFKGKPPTHNSYMLEDGFILN